MLEYLTNANLTELNNFTAIFRLLLSLIMGGIIGLGRTRKLRPAGLRTYMLVCIGACLVAMSGIFIFESYGPGFDPARMTAQVISGIGFIGAGTIMVTSNHKVKGLTTAAGLWAVACLGIAIGIGYYIVSIGAFIMLVLTMTYADRLEQRYFRHLKRMSIQIIIERLSALRNISDILKKSGIYISDIEITDALDKDNLIFCCVLNLKEHLSHQKVVEMIMDIEGVVYAEEIET